MTVPTEPTRAPASALFRLASGTELLDEWSRTATQAEKNVVNDVLLAIVGKSVFAHYDVIDDPRKTLEFVVLAKCDLAVKVRVYNLNSFGIKYVGPADLVPGLDYAGPDVEPLIAGA